MSQADSQLFVALAKIVRRRIGHFNVQDLAKTAWAFATVGEPTPALFAPILMLDSMEMKDAKPHVKCHQMLLASKEAHRSLQRAGPRQDSMGIRDRG